jgi:hypothetical protein
MGEPHRARVEARRQVETGARARRCGEWGRGSSGLRPFALPCLERSMTALAPRHTGRGPHCAVSESAGRDARAGEETKAIRPRTTLTNGRCPATGSRPGCRSSRGRLGMSAHTPIEAQSVPGAGHGLGDGSCFFCEEERARLRGWRVRWARMALADPTDAGVSRVEARITSLELSLLRHQCDRPALSEPAARPDTQRWGSAA